MTKPSEKSVLKAYRLFAEMAKIDTCTCECTDLNAAMLSSQKQVTLLAAALEEASCVSVPSDEDIAIAVGDEFNTDIGVGFRSGARWAIGRIKELYGTHRNQERETK